MMLNPDIVLIDYILGVGFFYNAAQILAFFFYLVNFLLLTLVNEAIFSLSFLVLNLVHIVLIVLLQFLMIDFIMYLFYWFTCADPYLNTDAGTMSPFEHGEVFVLDDGGEVTIIIHLNYE